MKKPLKIAVGAVIVLIAVILLTATFFLNSIVKKSVEVAGPRLMGVETAVAEVDLRPFRGRFRLRGVTVGSPEGFRADNMFSLGEVTVHMDMKSLFTDTIRIREILIDDPEITYEVGLSGSNIGRLMETVQAPNETETPSAPEQTAAAEPDDEPGKKVIIDSLTLRSGRVRIAAQMLGGRGAAMPLPTIRLTDLGKEKEGASPAEMLATVLRTVSTSVIGVVAQSGQLIGAGVKATADAALKGAEVAGDLTAQGVGAAVDAAGQAGAAVGRGVGAAGDAAGRAGTAVGRGATHLFEGVTGGSQRDDEAEEPEQDSDTEKAQNGDTEPAATE